MSSITESPATGLNGPTNLNRLMDNLQIHPGKGVFFAGKTIFL